MNDAPRPRRSVFLKLLLVFVLAGAANVAVMHVFYRHIVYDDARRMHRSQNMAEYADYLASRLAYPPDPASVAALAERLHLRVRVEGPGVNVASTPDVPAFEEVRSRMAVRYASERARVGKFHDFLGMALSRPPARYVFLLESEDRLDEHSRLILGFAAVLLSILLLAYLSIRWILAPLRLLERGVREVAGGNLAFALPPGSPHWSQDELGQLMRLFNDMTARVRSMVETKERLLLDVSHEFRSPLTRIKVAMELSGEEGRAPVRRAVGELEAMISELLESARLDDAKGKLRLEPVDLGLLIDELVECYRDQKPGVRRVAPDDVPAADPAQVAWVQADAARLRTAVQNVVENALKYSSNQDRPVEICLSRVAGRGELDKTSTPPEGASTAARYLVTVRDFGVGIAVEDQPLVFEPFYRVDRSRVKTTGGYGLGLALCQKIIEAHRGSIRLKSVPGKETLFLIELLC